MTHHGCQTVSGIAKKRKRRSRQVACNQQLARNGKKRERAQRKREGYTQPQARARVSGQANLILSLGPLTAAVLASSHHPTPPTRTTNRGAILCAAPGFSPTTHTRANLGEEPPATARRFAVRHRCSTSEDESGSHKIQEDKEGKETERKNEMRFPLFLLIFR